MFELDPVMLARIQFAFTVSFHIVFPAFTIGLSSFLAVLEWRWLKTGDKNYQELYKFWIKIFAVAFGMGGVSGVVMSYEFGTNWSVFSDRISNVLGPLLGFEVLTAFFLEASFLGIMLFGWGKVSNKMHFVSTCIVAIGTLISAFWILSANSWMQTPQGFTIGEDGRNTLRNPSLAETILQPANFPKSKTDLQNKNQGLPYQTKKAWSTVTTQDYKKRGPNSLQQGLHEESRNWPTVRTSSANGASKKEIEAGNPKQRLEVMITNWPTPRAQEPGSTSENYGKGLKNTAENWATPTARDWKDNASADVPTNSLLGRQAPRSMQNGTESQITLNPRFTEWLMGWPIGWTEFELAETEWFRWLQRMRGELLRMECISQKIN